MRKEEAIRKLNMFIKTYEDVRGYSPTQEECARYMGVSQTYVSRLIRESRTK